VSDFNEELLTEVLKEELLPADVVAELEPFPDRVRALVSAALVLLEEDPEEALRYALGAKKIASRSAAVRESVGITAYHAGQYELAARELRAAGRISGRDDLVPVIADCERALGRPERALELATRPVSLDRDDRVELRIVAAGARLDLGEPEEAVLMLQGQLLDSDEVSSPSCRLKYAYADALLAAGRADDARTWFLKAAAADPEAETDAVERALALDAPQSGSEDGARDDL
jgi:tetratricopeptide (TPR) repeat protein